MKSLNILIRELREDNDLTQKQVASVLGIAQQYYSKYETGEYELPTRHLITLSNFYHVSADYLLGITSFRHSLKCLNERYDKEYQTAELLNNALNLNKEGRKRLIEYLEFLVNRFGTTGRIG